MIFALSLLKDKDIAMVFKPYLIEKSSRNNAYKIIKELSASDIEKHEILQAKEISLIIRQAKDFNIDFLNQKFNKKPKATFSTYLKNASKKEKTYIANYLDAKNSKIIDFIKAQKTIVFKENRQKKLIYENDIYQYIDDLAQIKFEFQKVAQSLFYRLQLFIGNHQVAIKESNLKILCNKNPCICIQNRIIFFDENTGFNANKIKPFLLKDEIVIPERLQETYFEKFVKPAIENFECKINGFEVVHLETSIITILSIAKTFTNEYILNLVFKYNNKQIPYYWQKKEFIKVVKTQENYTLESIQRDLDFETSKKEILTNLGFKDKRKYFEIDKDFSSTSAFLNYIEPFVEKLKIFDFEIENNLFRQEISFEKPIISYQSFEKPDWFDLRIIIKFKNFEIPFIQFKDHILSNNAQFELPDKTIFIIPDEWFSELNYFAKRTRSDNITDIHKTNFSILQKNKIILPTKELMQTLEGFSSSEKIDLPKKITAKLRDYQEIGFQWLYRNMLNNFGVCLADDMGLGKTLQVITLLQKYFENKTTASSKTTYQQLDLFSSIDEVVEKKTETYTSCLLVLPRVLIINWKEELKKFAKDLTHVSYYGNKRAEVFKYNYNKQHIIITTYGVVRQDIDFLKEKRFSYIILDESQAIKNPNSKIYKAVMQLQSDYKISITGTPIENNLIDIWAQMNFLNHNILGNLNYFKKTYLETIKNNAEAPEVEDLKTIIEPFILRRLKKDVAKELPDRIEQTIYCEMEEAQRKQYEIEKSEVRNELLFNKTSNMINVLTVLNRLRQFVLHPKMIDKNSRLNSGKFEQITATIDNLIAQGEKFLIFSSFVKHLDIYKQYFEENGLKYALLTGKSKNPQEIVKNYQNKQNIKPFLISIKAGGVGLNITSANYVLIIDPWWNPFVEQQAIDRTHRIGQTKNVFIYKFITKNTIEEKIVNLQKRKMAMSDALINESNIKLDSKEILSVLV